ncbi:MAG: hypothetical protein OXR73_19190 [Myxococcales bacterium]|nr:hypothetical protein [Myxococcales bacterium]
MQSDLTLHGPKVHAQRDGTADAGGGRIHASAGQLAVQGPVRGRQLGALSQLASVQFHDHRGRTSDWTFADGRRWILRCDDDKLLEFSRALAINLQRPDMVRESLSPQAKLWSTTKTRRRELLVAAGCLLLALPIQWLVSYARPFGYLLVGLGLAWLLAGAVARIAEGDLRPLQLARLVAQVRRWNWILTWVAPSTLLVGSLVGITVATARAREDAVEAQRAAAQAATAAAEREAEARKAAERAAEIDEKLGEATVAVDEGRLEDAASSLAEASAIDPRNAKVESALAALAPRLEQKRDKQRARDARAGLSLAREVTSDRVLCDTAQAVADAWSKLGQTKPSDDTFSAALKLAPKLERCRKRVRATFAANARAASAQARTAWSTQLEAELRKQGVAASVTTGGKAMTELRIATERLDSETIETVMGGGDRRLKPRAAEQGYRRIVLTAGKKARKVRLKPVPGGDVGEVLSRFGLDKPIGF